MVATINDYVQPVKLMIQMYCQDNGEVNLADLQKNVNIGVTKLPRIKRVTLFETSVSNEALRAIPSEHHKAITLGQGTLLRLDVKYSNAFEEPTPFIDYIYLP